MIVRQRENLLPAVPDVLGDRAPAALHDQRARGAHVSPRGRAVESKVHETAGTQQCVEHAQTLPWIPQVMQHPARLDQIEAPPDAPELENIGLCKLYVADPELARFARGVAEAGQAEIDRKHVGAGKSLRCFERMLAGATAGDQDIDALHARGLPRSAPAETGCANTTSRWWGGRPAPARASADTAPPRTAGEPQWRLRR